ncbi:hypothetical protein HPP92_000316 [Vanilla planifolia]|uniref:Chlororespiratory reduction 4 n=1 Tax=Vanilla planifolia TaxID=51239 RepID=A0A835VFZ6_VANPL|nr:hypothetical protein HPP92_000316 [Vanilla planifolia]
MELIVEGGHVLREVHQTKRKFSPVSMDKYLSSLPKYRASRELGNILARMIVVGLFVDSMAVKDIVAEFSSAGLGEIEYAELILKQAVDPNSFLCNSVIRGFQQHNNPYRALNMYNWMILNSVYPDKFTFPFVLKACAGARALPEGEKIHCRILKSPFTLDLFVQASILAMYAKCGETEMARLTFDLMPHKSLVCWNTMIDGYVKRGDMDTALNLFNQMSEHDLFSWNVMINGYAKCGQVEKARDLFDKMLVRDAVTWNIMIDGYARIGDMKSARHLFDLAPFKDIVSWGIVINGYAMNRHVAVAHNLFEKSPCKSLITWNCLINGYGKCKDMLAACKLFELMPFRNLNSWNIMLDACAKCGEMALANQVFYAMPSKDIVSWNIKIDGHIRLGEIDIAREIFDTMPYKDVVTWNALLGGYKQNGQLKEVFELFIHMQILEVTPTFSTLAILLSVIADLGFTFHGKQVHAYLYRKDYLIDSIIGVALIDMYSTCGFVDKAMLVFDMVTTKNVDHWNAILSALASYGYGDLAISMFVDMELSMVRPDDITFIVILNACSHAGLVLDGHRYFILMSQKYGITPNVQHYGCMVDLLSRVGHLDEAIELINCMPMRANDAIWRALLGASRTHGSIEVAELAARHLIELVPSDSSSYVLLANIYGCTGQHGNAQNMWMIMNENGVVKNIAWSSIELQHRLHMFTAGDSSHSHVMDILLILNNMIEDLAAHVVKVNLYMLDHS